jgi:hypothetical protein
MKKIWLTSLGSSEDPVKKLIPQMKTYGLEINGHFWKDDLEKMAWIAAKNELIEPKISLWGILGSDEDLFNPTLRYGLSLLAITVQAQKGLGFPIIILQTKGDPISSDKLPTPFQGVDVFSDSDQGLGAKLVAKVYKPSKKISSEYRLDIYGNPQIGQWFEVGSESDPWPGSMFGVEGANIAFHAVGPKGELPSKSVLEYAMKGLKLNLGDKEYETWAVQNELDTQSSYYVKVEGFPESIVFGPYSTDEATDVYVVKLK